MNSGAASAVVAALTMVVVCEQGQGCTEADNSVWDMRGKISLWFDFIVAGKHVQQYQLFICDI